MALGDIRSQEQTLAAMFKDSVRNDLRSNDPQRLARAVYLAVSLNMFDQFKQEFPEAVKEGCESMSHFPRVMNNIFYGSEFAALDSLKGRFIKAGFIAPERKLTNDEIVTK